MSQGFKHIAVLKIEALAVVAQQPGSPCACISRLWLCTGISHAGLTPARRWSVAFRPTQNCSKHAAFVKM